MLALRKKEHKKRMFKHALDLGSLAKAPHWISVPCRASYTFFLIYKTIFCAHLPSINSPLSSHLPISFLISLIRLLSSLIYFEENTEIRWPCQWFARWFTQWQISSEKEEQSCLILSMGCNSQSGPSRQLKLIFLKSWWKKESNNISFFLKLDETPGFACTSTKALEKLVSKPY